MKRFVMQVEVKLVEIIEPEPIAETIPGSDPIHQLTGMLGKSLQAIPLSMMSYPPIPAGIDWRRSANITAGSFQTVAKILEQFEELTNEIALERV